MPPPHAAGPAALPSNLHPPRLSSLRASYHEAAKALFAGLADQGLAPDHTTYANLIRSHVQQALGWHRQPYGAALGELLAPRPIWLCVRSCSALRCLVASSWCMPIYIGPPPSPFAQLPSWMSGCRAQTWKQMSRPRCSRMRCSARPCRQPRRRRRQGLLARQAQKGQPVQRQQQHWRGRRTSRRARTRRSQAHPCLVPARAGPAAAAAPRW